MDSCDECGSTALRTVAPGALECELCGALNGADAAIERLELARDADRRGIDPRIFSLVRALEQAGWRVERADFGDVARAIWPQVQLRPSASPSAVMASLETLAKTLRLTASACEAHWVVEVEFTQALVFTLKPRFHREVRAIDAAAVRSARRDLQILERAIRRAEPSRA